MDFCIIADLHLISHAFASTWSWRAIFQDLFAYENKKLVTQVFICSSSSVFNADMRLEREIMLICLSKLFLYFHQQLGVAHALKIIEKSVQIIAQLLFEIYFRNLSLFAFVQFFLIFFLLWIKVNMRVQLAFRNVSLYCWFK